MTEQEQQIALCEWADKHGLNTSFMDHDGCEQVGLLDTDSLDVLHEMEKKLTDEQKGLYATWLAHRGGVTYVYNFDTIHATVAQRREALLRTLNLWTE